MKHIQNSAKNSGNWKRDPRIAYIPPIVLTSLFITLCLFVRPAFSFEVVESVDSPAVVQKSLESAKGYSCMSLLNADHASRYASERVQRPSDKATAFGLVLGVRFALSSAEAMPAKQKPRLGVWQTQGFNVDDRSAYAVSAYRDCQKKQALQSLNEFRWAR